MKESEPSGDGTPDTDSGPSHIPGTAAGGSGPRSPRGVTGNWANRADHARAAEPPGVTLECQVIHPVIVSNREALSLDGGM